METGIVLLIIFIYIRATIRPDFPGHVLFFGPEISVRADFVNYIKCPEFWPNP